MMNYLLKMNRNTVVAMSFAVIILSGALLLMLPITHTNGGWLPFIDALFTATSATCVVGLVVVDTGTYFNRLGHMIIIMLIQIGGVGVMTLTTMIILGMGRKLGLKERMLVQESLNQDGPAGVIELTKLIFRYTLAIEFIFGTGLGIYFYFNTPMGLESMFYGYWHSVSAFCNAGFDLMGNYDSLTGFRGDYFVNFCIISLITLGGLGFAVEGEILHKRSWKRFSLHTKMVLFGYLLLSLGGAIIIWLFEIDNPASIGNLPQHEQYLSSLFQSVTCRTAGFNTVDISAMHEETLVLMMFLMFVGGAPASTAGGIKITTFLIIMMTTIAYIRDRSEIVFFHKRIRIELIHKSLGIFVLCLLWLSFAFFLILTADSDHIHFHLALCELFSAFGTVGLGCGITDQWSSFSKVILIITMFIGRIGILTFTMSLFAKKSNNLSYPYEDVIIG